MLQPQIILQYLYKLLIWSTSYWFLFRPTININFSFTNNHSSHQQFVKLFIKKFVSLGLLFCGAKWCMNTYTSTFNNNIWHALQRVGHLLHGWTLFSWFLANPLKMWTLLAKPFHLFTTSLALDYARPSTSIGSTEFTEGSHWGSTNSLSGVPRPFGAFLWYFTIRAECIFSHCNHAFKHDFHGLNIQQRFVFKG